MTAAVVADASCMAACSPSNCNAAVIYYAQRLCTGHIQTANGKGKKEKSKAVGVTVGAAVRSGNLG